MTKKRSVTIVGDDTDQLVLMLHNLGPSNHDIFFQTTSKIINILTLQDYISPHVAASPMLFLHSSKVASRSMYLPTCDAARYHSYRVYHQVQTWLGNDLDPTKWLLRKGQNVERLKPVKMRGDPAPASLLKLIKCNCHNKGDKNSCFCHKNGLSAKMANFDLKLSNNGGDVDPIRANAGSTSRMLDTC